MENINLNHVVIFGYREKYYVNPNVTVYKNGMLIGMVAHLGRSQFEINEPCELAFNVRHQTITCKVNPGDQIQLSLNRWSGKLIAQLIENSNSHQELIEKNKQQDSVGESGKSTAQLIENSNSHQEIIERNKQQDSVGESGKSTAQLIENSNSHQEIIERNKQQDRKGVKKLVIFIVLMGIIVGACWIPSILDSSSSSSSYIAEARELGFPTYEINQWIKNAMDQYNCSLVEVTSVKANGEWCLKLYVDVLYYNDFRSKGEPHKGVISLYFEPSDGRIWSGDFKALD